MQPVSLLLEGDYWDSQIYSGELTLFGADGSYHRINWADLIDGMALAHPEIQTALRVAFSDSDLFYTQKVRKILRDPEIEVVIKRQLNALSAFALEASEQSWKKFWRTSDSPFDFLPVDTDIYYHNVFAGGDDGLFSALRSGGGSKSISPARRHHDGRVLQVKASNQSTAVAIAAGADGLMEFAFKSSSETLLESQRTLAKRSCSSCEWAFQSVFAWDTVSAYLANFRREKDPRTNRSQRIFDGIIGEERMFPPAGAPSESYVWGSHEKIFRVSSSGLEVANYAPPPERKPGSKQVIAKPSDADLFQSLGSIALVDIDPTQIVATSTAPFGSIVELPDRLVVLRSDGEVNVFLGEPVRWRVFPRSEHYSNQLHIVYDDRIQIISFVHDYFVEQKSKLTGFARGSNDFIVGSSAAKDA